ncbi:HD domain-containing protein [Candidatus Saccharibacteria bacterium]|nr:HD domain-containing protein [Candidatus Saccharibacteria bacterium]
MPKHDHLRTLPIVERYPDDLWGALNFAAKAHENQTRKAGNEQYITHPFDVMQRVRIVTDDIDVQVGAVLHDTVEDTPVTIKQLEQLFGARVAHLVWGVTKDDSISGWHQRNEAWLERLQHSAEEGSVVIALGDKTSNLGDMIRNNKKYGQAFWRLFNAQPKDQLWWYSSVLHIAQSRAPDCQLTGELEILVETFREEVVYGAHPNELGRVALIL